MIKDKNFIITGIDPWEKKSGNSGRHIAFELARFNRVLYVNPPMDRSTAMQRKNEPEIHKRISVINGQYAPLEHVRQNLWNLYPVHYTETFDWIRNPFLSNLIQRLNNSRIAGNVRSTCESLGMHDYILLNDQSELQGYYIDELLDPEIFICYLRDDRSTVEFTNKDLLKKQNRLLEKADLVIANSDELVKMAKAFNPNSHAIGWGCDLSLYLNGVDKADFRLLNAIPTPRIGIAGELTGHLYDLNLIECMAESRKDWHFVLLGREDESFKASRLHSMNNVYFMGERKSDEWPGIIQEFDVCINPQVHTEADGIARMLEYLAMNKPVVSTPLKVSNAIADYVHIADNTILFIRSIEGCLNRKKIRPALSGSDFAMAQSWENGVEKLGHLIEQKLRLRTNARA